MWAEFILGPIKTFYCCKTTATIAVAVQQVDPGGGSNRVASAFELINEVSKGTDSFAYFLQVSIVSVGPSSN